MQMAERQKHSYTGASVMRTPAAPWLPVEDAAMLLSDANGPQQLCGAFEDRNGRASGLSESCVHSQKAGSSQPTKAR